MRGLRMRTIVLDPSQRVAATFDSRLVLAAAEAIGGIADSMCCSGGAGQGIMRPVAPAVAGASRSS
ncbi:MAG: hypothetical protein JSR91_04320 [Proteobacteria bacterium]|nr:hypothetical protein [Pseudomonadota bacterium]